MRTNFHVATVCAVFVALPSLASAQDKLAFSTAVDMNYKRLTLTAVSGTTTNEFRPELWTLGVSPSLAYRRVFLSLGFERTLGEGSTTGYITNGTVWSDRRYTRSENNGTLGYNLWEGLSVFGGYLNNVTKTTFTNFTVGSAGLLSYGAAKNQEYGPYCGLGYSHQFGQTGSVAASYAYLKGTGRFTQDIPSNASNSQFRSQVSDGDVTGSSFGLSWSAPLAGSVYYRLGYKGTRYDFTFVDATGNQRRKQNYDALVLGIANYF
jgi:hypothetical protein